MGSLCKLPIYLVGRIGQCSNQFIEDLEKIEDFLEQNKTLLDIIEEPF
jgi:hypothetical protein